MSRHLPPRLSVLAALLAGLYIFPAAALTITFDDLTDTSAGFGGTPIPDAYQGLIWTNWNVLDTADATNIFGPSGAAAGTVTPPNVAYNPDGGEAIFSSATPFVFDSADLTAVWNQGMFITVTGLLNGVAEDQEVLSPPPSATGPTLYSFDWAGINEVDILPTAGVPFAGYSGAGTQLALDDLTITPIPEPCIGAILGPLAIMAAGLAGVGRMRRREAA